ncbi:glycosyltransferase [Pseudonocardia sp.]|uniref:glycosyltransferase n=1 Tax=Pseudonocardia sp. TaxID=60912 RepID=UPI00260F4A61|nr:glycosyltransferase [Pseudonocardia sp.]
MRIDMVSEHASPLAGPGGPDSGGQNVHVAELSRALGALGHEITVWTRRDDPALPPEVPYAPGVTVRHLDAGPPTPLPKDRLVPHVPQMAAELERAWAAQRPDLVHGHFWMSGLAAVTAAGRVDVPVVQTFHALGAVKRRHQRGEDTSPAGRVAAEQAVGRRADRVIATCSDEAFELARLGVRRSRVSVVPCGVDTDTFRTSGPTLRRRDGVRRIVSVGRLVRRKGVDETVSALARVPGTELLIAGGPAGGAAMDDDPDIARLRAVAAAAGVADRVRFLGAVPRSRVAPLLRSADAVVCVPWYEPFGMVPLEAMACARPVVASAVGGLTDTVVDDVTGLLVPPRHPERLAGALRHLLGSPVLMQAFGVAGRDRAESCYRWSRIAESTVGVYERALADRRPAAASDVVSAVAR